jgi:hypothetical protein
MKTVEEVIRFLESEIKRLRECDGYYEDDVLYLEYLIEQIKTKSE